MFRPLHPIALAQRNPKSESGASIGPRQMGLGCGILLDVREITERLVGPDHLSPRGSTICRGRRGGL